MLTRLRETRVQGLALLLTGLCTSVHTIKWADASDVCGRVQQEGSSSVSVTALTYQEAVIPVSFTPLFLKQPSEADGFMGEKSGVQGRLKSHGQKRQGQDPNGMVQRQCLCS